MKRVGNQETHPYVGIPMCYPCVVRSHPREQFRRMIVQVGIFWLLEAPAIPWTPCEFNPFRTDVFFFLSHS